ncbi:hypothetical protein E8E11_003068 [Didymella keratinophila]|nr:hypothetical protein E8E11_003068 [Didymella keratinophila]
MNWTGGTLQRTKHANKGVIQKQKAHFARARTQLQHSPGTPAAPFRPDFLQGSDTYDLGQRLPAFSTGSVRRTGHSARKHREEGNYHSPTTQKPRHTHGHSNSQGRSPHFSQSRRHTRDDNERQEGLKRKGADADSETQLLEANKERLLRQQDWVGVARSRPVDMHFLSIKEKSRTGKRRKLDAKNATSTRRQSPTTFLRQTGQDQLVGHDDTFMSGALPVLTTADNIRIRIGSEVLTTAASTQPNNDARSQTKSDSMLFDEEGEDATQVLESDAPRSIPSASHTHAADPRLDVSLRVQSDRSYLPEQGPYARNNPTQRPDDHAKRNYHTAAGSDVLDQSSHESEATGPSYRLMHHVGGVERPLKLVFGKRRPSMTSPAASAIHRTGELQHVHADLTAKETKTGYVSRNFGEPPQLGVRRHPYPPSIDDQEPWRPYLDTGTSSSGHVRVDDGTGTSVPQPHVPAQNTKADRTSWPQHAAQGNLTHVNLSKVSASLPAVTPQGGRVPAARPLPRPSVIKEVNNDEALWQSFVLGSDPQSTTETIHTHSEASEDSMSRATKGYASTRLPLSNAVTSVSSIPFPSTPFKSLSGQASRISDDVQYAPHSGSRSITSMASDGLWGRINSPSEEDVQDEDQGEEISARSRFSEQSPHASLQNHASHDSAMFSNTGTSCSESGQRGRAWKRCLPPGWGFIYMGHTRQRLSGYRELIADRWT